MKDAFSACFGQRFFAFEQEDPNGGEKDSINLDSVTQGCENSSMIFESWSTREPETWVPPSQGRNLLQYVDITETKEDCVQWTEFAEFFGLNDYQVSQQKAQITP